MPLRQLTDTERQNLARLTSLSLEATLIQPTATALVKSIMDATRPVRSFLRQVGLHDYDQQGSGANENGVQIDAVLLGPKNETLTTASLYRPKAKGKGGDPRIWFYGLTEFAAPDDILALLKHDGGLLVINITRTDIGAALDTSTVGPLQERLLSLSKQATSVADELLERLRWISRQGPVPSVMLERADTAIGRTLEHALGIQINSRKEPDYKGIELKSFRRQISRSRENRKTLFARVPDWHLSRFKSSREILDAFGYARGADFKLYCTLSTQVTNSQGLKFQIDTSTEMLNEFSTRTDIGVFATWSFEGLRKSLVEKHNETFWVSADVRQIDGHDHFEFRDVLHTRKAIATQFDVLLEQGEITMDHLIKRNAAGRVSEKGPLFKINAASLPLLFPPSQVYTL